MRNKIGIIYNNNNNWIGGTYYIQNIISSLNNVPEQDRPDIVVYAASYEDFQELQRETKYKNLSFFNCGSRIYKCLNFLNRAFFKLTKHKYWLFDIFFTKVQSVSFVYPYRGRIPLNYSKRILTWIPDFQEVHLPHLFSPNEIVMRNEILDTICRSNCSIVFSSKDAEFDFHTIRPLAKNRTYTLSFTVSHPDFSKERIDNLRAKYNITGEYLFCANQYWTHKNHKFLYSAYLKARQNGLKLKLVCSGKMSDKRSPEYINELIDFIKTNKLENDIVNIGFIPRTEQLCLMQNSYAIIQPSLFEGWNTTVEDAKCLNKFIFLSDLAVHREQNPLNVCFFNPEDTDDLVQKLLNICPTDSYFDYDNDRKQQGKTVMSIIKSESNV